MLGRLLLAAALVASSLSAFARNNDLQVNLSLSDRSTVSTQDVMVDVVFTNTGSTPIHLLSASSPISPMVQMHETVMGTGGAMAMQEKQGGFTIPAGGSHEFKAGGDHVMFMGVSTAVKSGTTVTFTLAFEDGSTLPVTAEVRTFTGAKETYVPGATTGTNSMPGMTPTPGTSGTTASHG